MGNETTSPIDRETLDRLYELQDEADPHLVADLIRMFIDLSPPRLDRISEGLSAGDARRIEREAHDLKSSAANLGALALSAAAAELETLGRKGAIEAIPAALEQLRREMKRARAELLSLLGSQ
jgi:HPt (histidine-containing phosphotransfer) domain-containing protein